MNTFNVLRRGVHVATVDTSALQQVITPPAKKGITRGIVNYVQKPVNGETLHLNVYTDEKNPSNLVLQETEVTVHDIRAQEQALSLEQNGFGLYKLQIPDNINWDNQEEVKHYPSLPSPCFLSESPWICPFLLSTESNCENIAKSLICQTNFVAIWIAKENCAHFRLYSVFASSMQSFITSSHRILLHYLRFGKFHVEIEPICSEIWLPYLRLLNALILSFQDRFFSLTTPLNLRISVCR